MQMSFRWFSITSFRTKGSCNQFVWVAKLGWTISAKPPMQIWDGTTCLVKQWKTKRSLCLEFCLVAYMWHIYLFIFMEKVVKLPMCKYWKVQQKTAIQNKENSLFMYRHPSMLCVHVTAFSRHLGLGGALESYMKRCVGCRRGVAVCHAHTHNIVLMRPRECNFPMVGAEESTSALFEHTYPSWHS